MPAFPRRLRLSPAAALALLLVACTANQAFSQPPPPPPPPPQPMSWLKVQMKYGLFKHPFLKPPFLGAADEAKALASEIKAEQKDAKNRVKAVEFLGTVDCITYPESQAALVGALNDPSERVRLAAAEALQVQMERGRQKKPSKKDQRRYDTCRGCCTDLVIEALSKVVYEMDEFGCPIEPSARVRQAALEALQICVPYCYPAGTFGVPGGAVEGGVEGQLEEALPPAPGTEEALPPSPEPSASRHDAGPNPALLVSGQKSHAQPLQFADAQPAGQEEALLPPLESLRGYCIVAMKEKRFVKAQPQFQAVWEGRIYQFSNLAAQREFERWPQAYAVAYAGFDPVHAARNGEIEVGVFLREHEGRFYLFLSKENWEFFQSHAEYLALADNEAIGPDQGD